MYFYIFIFLIGSGLCASNVTKMNTGTVLFSELDVAKECWNPDDVALLTTRFFFEDILPDKNSLNIHDNSYVNDLVDYFRLLLDVVRKNTHGKTKQITLRALIDVLGGYLYRYVLPTARYSYYAGYINYGSIEKLNKLFDELKCFLRTNGQGWIKARGPCGVRFAVEPLQFPPVTSETNPCITLTVVEGESKNVEIPLPFLDSRADPSAIALPFKAHPLLEIESKAASYVLVKYYVTSMKCLHYHNANQTDLKQFTSTLYAWIENQVLPLLNNDKFYSAFGGVLRIKETLKGMGVHNEKQMGNYNIMPEMQVKDSIKYDADETSTGKKKSDLILTALLATIFIWFLLGSIFICYRIKAGRYRKRFDDKALLNITTCSCKSSRKTSSESEQVTSNKEYILYSSTESKTRIGRSPTTSVCSIESKQRTTPVKRKKSRGGNIVCYMETKEGDPLSFPPTTRNDQQNKSSLMGTKPDGNESTGLAVQTSFSEGFPGSSSSDEILRDQIITDFNIDTASTSSESTI